MSSLGYGGNTNRFKGRCKSRTTLSETSGGKAGKAQAETLLVVVNQYSSAQFEHGGDNITTNKNMKVVFRNIV